ncbi:MAG: glycosyltransferase 87 family protein, partial [Lysobacterales bacterium]
MKPLIKGSGHYFRDPLTLVLATLVALSFLGTWLYAKNSPGIDYYVAWVAADAVKSDTRVDIYEPSSRYKLAVEYRNKADLLKDAPKQKQVAAYLKELQMTATPFLYWVTGLLASGNYENDLTRWQLLSLFLVTAFILVTCRVLGYSPATSLAILLPVLVWFTPLYSNLNVANVNGFQLGLIGLILWLQSRSTEGLHLFGAGLIAGLLVMFKPNIAPVALLFGAGWVVRGQYLKLGIL